MQRPRDPSDRRYWPARLQGTGQGFTRHGKARSPHYGGSLNRSASLSLNPRPDRVTPDTVDYAAKLVDAEAVRARARQVSIRLLDRLDAVADSMVTEDTVAALNAAGKLTGVQVTTQNVTGSVAHLHLDALRQLSAERRLSNSSDASATASARMLPNSPSDNELVEVEGDSASPGREGDAGEGAETP